MSLLPFLSPNWGVASTPLGLLLEIVLSEVLFADRDFYMDVLGVLSDVALLLERRDDIF